MGWSARGMVGCDGAKKVLLGVRGKGKLKDKEDRLEVPMPPCDCLPCGQSAAGKAAWLLYKHGGSLRGCM